MDNNESSGSHQAIRGVVTAVLVGTSCILAYGLIYALIKNGQIKYGDFLLSVDRAGGYLIFVSFWILTSMLFSAYILSLVDRNAKLRHLTSPLTVAMVILSFVNMFYIPIYGFGASSSDIAISFDLDRKDVILASLAYKHLTQIFMNLGLSSTFSGIASVIFQGAVVLGTIESCIQFFERLKRIKNNSQ